MTDNRRLLLLDTASLYYRAFFGLPTSLKAPDGTVTNALRGLIDFLARLLDDHAPAVVVACWDDDWRPEWRVRLIPSYKAHRLLDSTDDVEDTPAELGPQVPLIAEALGLLGVPVVGSAGFEADDVIATYASAWKGPVDIVTGDRDLLQLIDDERQVRVLYTARGVTKLDVFDEAALHAKYGVAPGQYVDFAVLRGDPSDGLAGVKGIGDKTAARLVSEFGSLSAIRRAAEDETSGLTPRVRSNVLAAADYMDRAARVATARIDVPVPTAALGDPDWDAFEAFAQRWGLGSVAARIRSTRS